jgi:hypothetical protein
LREENLRLEGAAVAIEIAQVAAWEKCRRLFWERGSSASYQVEKSVRGVRMKDRMFECSPALLRWLCSRRKMTSAQQFAGCARQKRETRTSSSEGARSTTRGSTCTCTCTAVRRYTTTTLALT